MKWQEIVPKNPFDVARVWKIAASAGCGKTYTARRVINELIESGVKPVEIMYVCFNRLPTIEFKAQFPDLESSDMKWWASHHAIALRLLRKNHLLKSRKVMTDKDWSEFMKLYRYDFDQDKKDIKADTAYKLFNGRSLYGEEQRYLDRLRLFEEEHDLLSFDSMLFMSLERTLFPEEVKYIFVDEAQDNGKIQNDYWLRILDEHPIKGFMLIGDDKQAINGFKGGDAKGFLEFPAEISVSFPTSYRCPKPILSVANKIAEPIANRSPLIAESKSRYDGEVRYIEKLAFLMDDIKSKISHGEDVMILARENKIVDGIKDVLNNFNIPFHSNTNETIRRVFRAFADIKRTGAVTSQELALFNPYSDPDEKRQQGSLRLTSKYFDKKKRKAFLKSRKNLSESQASILDSFEEETLQASRLEDACQLGFTEDFILDILKGKPDPDCFLGKNIKPIVERVEGWIEMYGVDYSCVRPLTIHTSKGMESENVVVVTDLGRFLSRQEYYQEEDERRVWYVATTRSLKNLVITQLSQFSDTSRYI